MFKVMIVTAILTFGAIVALPAGQTDDLAGRGAAVMSELVVAGAAQILATLSVIVRVAGDAILKSQR